jgi:hypothetical protein
MIPASERAKRAYALAHAATVIDNEIYRQEIADRITFVFALRLYAFIFCHLSSVYSQRILLSL